MIENEDLLENAEDLEKEGHLENRKTSKTKIRFEVFVF